MCLADLPSELLRYIISFAKESDLKRLRLVCKVFETIATPPLFAHLTLWLEISCLKRLVLIANHLRIRHYVRSLTIGNEWLDVAPPSPKRFALEFVRNRTPSTQQSRIPRRLFKFQTSPLEISRNQFRDVTVDTFFNFDRDLVHDLEAFGWSPERLFTAYKTCGYMLLEQDNFVTTRRDVFYLANGIKGLPNLRTVNITATIEIEKLQVDRTVRRGSVDPCGTPCDGEHRSWGVCAVAEKVIAIRPRQDGRQFDVFLRAVAPLHVNKLHLINISELQVDDSIWGDQGLDHSGYNLGKLGPKTITSAAPALQLLRTLKLPLGRCENGEVEYRIGNRATQLLSGLTLLEHLTVQSCHNSQADCGNILEGLSTQSLRSISLDSFIYRASSFKGFLRKHSKTLKEMNMKDARLLGCRLEELFRFMRENMSLENLVLKGHLGEFKVDWKRGLYEDIEDSEPTIMTGTPREPGLEVTRSISDFVTRKSDRYPLYVLRHGYLTAPWIDSVKN